MVRYLRAANVVDGALDLSDVKEMNFSPAEQKVFALRKGDILVTEGSGSLRTVGASAVWNGELDGVVCFQNTLLRLRPRSSATEVRFLAWWCRHAYADGIFAANSTGANIYHLSAERLRMLSVAAPTLDVQRTIADFLDVETASVDALVAAKQTLMDLIDERFESAVFFAVTHGLREDPLKLSGLSWVGHIAESWGTPSVSVNFELQLGKMLNADAAQGSEPYPYVRNVNVQWDGFDLDDLAQMHFGKEDRRRYALQPGDLLVCEGGEVGRAAVWPGNPTNCYFQKAIHRVRPRAGANSRFLMYCLRAAAKHQVFAVEGNLSTIAHLTGEQLGAHRFPWPSIPEQADIVQYLDAAAGGAGAAKTALALQIELLKEHQQALITAAVTGHLDIPRTSAA